MTVHPDYDFYNFRSEPDLEARNYSVDIEIRDGWGRFIGLVTDWIDFSFTRADEATDVEASGFKVPGSSAWAKTLMRANRMNVLVHIILYRDDKEIHTWTGRVERSTRKIEGPQGTITVDLISDKAWLKFILAQNSPFSALWIQSKQDLRSGQAVTVMKEYLTRNLTRIAHQDNGHILTGAQLAINWNIMNEPSRWSGLQGWMWPVTVVPSRPSLDKSPFISLLGRMTPLATLFNEVARDYNILVKAHYHVPGRDQAPSTLPMPRGGVWIDVVDMDKARSRGEKPSFFGQFTREISIQIRGLFGKYDTPRALKTTEVEDLKDWFGREETDPWVIFRYSREHWSNIEISSYSPTSSRTTTGGKSPESINRGIEFLINKGLQILAAQVGIPLPNILGGELDDVLLAYRDFTDKGMREELGPMTFYEEFVGNGLSPHGVEAAQLLRESRSGALGYRTAVFSADSASFPPFLPFEDFDILDQVGFEDPDAEDIQLERVRKIEVGGDREGINFEIVLGESARPEDPIAIQQRRNEMFMSAILALADAD